MKNKRLFRLTASYLAVIMAISLFFSVTIFSIVSAEIGKKPPKKIMSPNMTIEIDGQFEEDEFEIFYYERAEFARSQAIVSLGVMNFIILVSGSFSSFILARWTLRPIEDAFLRQEQFISDASHEMRTPLASMMMSNEVALRKKELTEERSREVLRGNIREIENLTALIDGLLGLAKIENNALEKDKFLANDLVLSVFEKAEMAANNKNISIISSVNDFEVEANYFSLSQIVSIFIDNAIKYSPEKSNIEIFAQKSGKMAVFEVRDQGSGVSKKDKERIFERFYRADSSRQRTGEKSYGLGLALAKKLADQSGAEIFVRDNPAGGAIFGVRIKQ